MSRMMRSHADALNGRNERMFGDAGILGDHLFQHGGDGLLPRLWEEDAAMIEGLHRFVAGSARGEKNDGRSEMLLTKSDESDQPDESREACSFIPFEMTTKPDSVTVNRWASASRS